jgi:hypothetical protein
VPCVSGYNKAINKYMPECSRPIPFERMIFLGDGDTDIPTMKMLTYQAAIPSPFTTNSKNRRIS